jgi:hypothetical protein
LAKTGTDRKRDSRITRRFLVTFIDELRPGIRGVEALRYS